LEYGGISKLKKEINIKLEKREDVGIIGGLYFGGILEVFFVCDGRSLAIFGDEMSSLHTSSDLLRCCM
jgi:hypothetical protein